LALAACLGGVGWQIENGVRFSFLFASAAFAVLCIHWLLEELQLVQAEATATWGTKSDGPRVPLPGPVPRGLGAQ